MATEDNLVPLENGQGINHIDSSDSIPPPPPLMPPPPPPPMPPEAKGQPEDLMTFKDEDCAEPCMEPLAPEVEPPPPVPEMMPPSDMDAPVPEEEPPPSAEGPGFVEPLPSEFAPPPEPEVDTEPPAGIPEPEMKTFPHEEEPLPPASLEDFSSDNLGHSAQNDMDFSPPNDVETSHPSVEPPSIKVEEVPETEYPAPDTETLPSEVDPTTTHVDPLPPDLEPVPNEEEIAAPTWSDEPEPVVDYPPPGLNHLPSDMYPEPVMAEPLPSQAGADTYPAEAEAPADVEALPTHMERNPESETSEVEAAGQIEAASYKMGDQEIPVELSAMAASPHEKDGSHGVDSVPPGAEPPTAYDMNTSPRAADLEPMGIAEPPREDHVHAPQATTFVLPPQGYDVIDEEQGQTTGVMVAEEQKGGGGETCCERCVRCLSHVPCGSLISWILLVLGLGALAGSVLVGTRKAQNLLQDDNILWFMDLTVTGVVVAMFVLGTCFLVVAHLSSEPTCRRLFNSTSKNTCARGLNIFLLVFVYILFVCWVLLTALLTTPVILLVMLFLVIGDMQPGDCLDLKNYGFPTREVCFPELHSFEEDAKDVLICYGVTLLSAILVVVSLVHFLICLSANITHLRDNRFAALNSYEAEEEHNSKHAMLDTNM